MSSQGPSQTTQSGPPQWLQDYAQQYLGHASQVAQQPYQPYNGPRVADLSGLQNQALSGMGALAGGTPSLHSADNYLNQTLNGGFQNQYQQGVIDRTVGDVTDAYNNATATTTRRANTPGNWQSARHDLAQGRNDENLARGLTEGIAGIRSADYNSDMNRRQQAAGMAPQLTSSAIGSLGQILQAGAVPQIQQQRLIDSLYGDFTDQRDYNRNQTDYFGNSIGRALGGSGSSSTTRQGYDPVSQGLGLITLGSQAYGNSGGGKGGYGAPNYSSDVMWN